MKKILMFLLLTTSFAAFAQVPFEDSPVEAEEEVMYPEENYDEEMFLQKQEDMVYPPPSENSEDFIAEEEVYDSESDYND